MNKEVVGGGLKGLVMCLADPTGNPRPNRIIRLLAKQGYEVDVLSFPFKEGQLPVRKVYSIRKDPSNLSNRTKRILLGGIASILFRTSGASYLATHFNDWRLGISIFNEEVAKENYDLIIVENLELLPFAIRTESIVKVLFDAREFFTKEFEKSIRFRIFDYPMRHALCSEYLHRCDFLITVSPGLAAAYKEIFDVEMTVIQSVPYYHEKPVNLTRSNSIRMVHHGIANVDRGLQNMIEIVRRLDSNFTLDFYLVGEERNISYLKKNAQDCERIRFLEPVGFEEIISMLNSYDIGLYYLEPTGFNVTFNLPNKFFEFIQARLALAIGPSPDMAEVVRQYQCGFIAEEFSIESMVNTLKDLTSEKIDLAKKNSDIAAKDLCYEKESERLLNLIQGTSLRSENVDCEE